MIGRLIIPGRDPAAERLLRRVMDTWHNKRGARYTRAVNLVLEDVCDTFRLEPEVLAELSGSTIPHDDYCQLAFVESECPIRFGGLEQKAKPCAGFMHSRYYGEEVAGKHYRVLSFHGSSIEVCKRLRELFGPVTTGHGQGAGGVTLPDLSDIADRVGLTDFLKGGT